MLFLHTADWHLDQANLPYTVPAIERAINEAPPYDVFVMAGDLAVHRGHIHPNVAHQIRRLIDLGARKANKRTAIVIAGNHDQSYNPENAGVVKGVLDTFRRPGDIDAPRIMVIEQPRTVRFDGVSLVCIPTPNKFWARTVLEDAGEDASNELISSELEAMVRGMIAEEHGQGGKVAVVYHGTVTGARLGNEQVMAAGMDIGVPHSAFHGADVVMAGHIHHNQVMEREGLPPVYYPGAPAPLTWNDKALEPAWFHHELAPHQMPQVGTVRLQVLSQMIEVHIEAAADAPDVFPWAKLIEAEARTAGADAGDRVRVTVSGPSSALDQLTPAVLKEVELLGAFEHVKAIYDRTDAIRARFDVDQKWSVMAAFERYMDFHKVPDDDRQPLREVVAELEAKVVDDHLDAHYECVPRRLTVRNWCQYEQAELRFDELGSLVAVDGDNYAGKSNLMRATAFARYKLQLTGNKLSDLIRIGEDSCEVEEEWTHGEQAYLVKRVLKRSKGGGARAELNFWRLNEDGTKTPVVEGTAAETQAAIDRLIGPAALYLATSYAGQNDVDGLLDLGPAELKDLLLSVLQRNFEGRTEILNDRQRDLAKQLERQHGVIEAVEDAAGLEEIATQECQLQGDICQARQALEELADEDELDLKVERANQAVADAMSQAKDYAVAVRARADIQNQLADAKAEAQASDRAQGKWDQLDAQLSELPPDTLEEDLVALSEARQSRDTLAASWNDEVEEKRKAKAEAAELAAKARRALDAAEAKRDQAARELTRARRDAELLSGVPCEGGQWHHEDGTGPVPMGGCQFLVDATTARDQLDDLDALVKAAHNEVAVAAEANRDLTAQAVAATDELERVLGLARQETAKGDNAVKEAEAQVARAQVAKGKLDRLVAEQAGLKPLIEEGGARRAKVGTLEIALDEARAIVAEFPGSQEEVEAALAAAQDKARTARSERSHNRDRRQALLAEQGKAERELAALEGKREAMAEQKLKLEEAEAEAARLTGLIGRVGFVAKALHRDGIPFLLLEQFAIPGLQALVNEYLEPTNLRVSVDSERELTSGELRNEVVLMFDDHRGRHPLSAASGMQRTAIGIALRNALADLHARATGSFITLSVQDEGFGTMTEENLQVAKVMIQQVAKRRGWFVFISHVGGMSSIADSIVTVTDQGSHSTVEVLS